MAKQCLITTSGPRAIGPYSAAVRVGNLVFCSGVIPIHPDTGEIVGTDIRTQTRQVLRNLSAILQDNDLALSNVVKTTCFLANIDDFAEFNEVYGEFFAVDPPARTTVEVSRLPKGVMVEVEAIAEVPE